MTSSRSIAPLDAACGVGELLLELGNAPVLELAGLGEVAAALRLLELEPRGVELLLDLGLAGDLVLFRLPALGQLGRLLLEVGELLLELARAGPSTPCRCSFFSASRSILSWMMRRSRFSISSGLDSTSMRIRLAASSIRSIALSGRKRSVM